MTSPVIPPASTLSTTLQTQTSRQQESQSLSTRREANNGTVSLSSSQTTTSSSTLTRISSGDAPRPVDSASATQSINDAPSNNEVSNNILQFVAQRLAQLQQQGASPEELREQLDKAKIGFLRGVAQAEEILAGKQLLDDDQQQRIDNIVSRFNEGVARISNNLGLSTADDFEDKVESVTQSQIVDSDNKNAATTPGTTVSLNSQSTYTQSTRSKVSTSNIGESEKSTLTDNSPAQLISRFQETRNTFLRQDSIDLQLRTQDGDIVNITFFASQAGANGSRSRSITLGESNSQIDITRQFSSYFGETELQLSVIGEIDDEEFAALESLLGQANEIANAFFNGDDVSAFNQALTLDIDSEEIANFSLDLQSRELQQSTQRYREIAGLTQENKQNLAQNSERDDNSNSRKASSLGSLLQQIRDIAIQNAGRRFEESFVEKLLSINFAAASVALAQEEEEQSDNVANAIDAATLETTTVALDTNLNNNSDKTEAII